MARTKTVNKDMLYLVEVIAEHQSHAARVRAKHMRAAEAEISEGRTDLLRAIFQDFPNAGDSEIANSTGLSRSTVVRWRKDFEALGLPTVDRVVAPVEAPPVNRPLRFGSMTWEGHKTAYIEREGVRLFLLTGEDFGEGEDVEAAERAKVERPDWLTDDIMRQAIDETGANLMLAPWK